ncbi:MAG: PQQ-binding-like beta-propeller repeat protein [Pirellulaceae bacterium]
MIGRSILSLITIGILLSLCDPFPVAFAHDNPFLANEADDIGWPHIRGGNYDGISAESNLANAWPASGPPVLWTKELGQGYSSIVVHDDRAYTQYQSLAGQFVICMDASSGETIWQYRYDWPFEATGLYPGPRSTPTIADGKIYFATPAGSVGCLNRNGRMIWKQDLKTKFVGKGTDFGYACSPTVIGRHVIMPVGGRGASMVALDANDGSVIWKSGDASASYTPAFPISVNGHPQIIGHMEHDLVAHDFETGRILWQKHLSRGYDEHSAWPIFQEPYLLTAAPFQAGSQLYELNGGDDASANLVWQSPEMSNDVSSCVLVDGHLYGFDLVEAQTKAHRPSRGTFRCMDFLTGETKWSNGDPKTRRSTDFAENAKRQIIGHANVVAADGKLLLFNDLGDLILAKIDPHEYVELARTPALGGQICWTTPALNRGRVFLRNHSRAVCLYVGRTDLLSRVASGPLLTVDDIPQGSVRDFSSLLGVEPEYAMDPPTYRWLNNWLCASLAILAVAGLIAALAAAFLKTTISIRWCFWVIVMLLGLFTGTIASRSTGDFVFTWPVTLFAAFQIAIYHSASRRSIKTFSQRKRWQDRFIAIGFLLVCLAYFIVCRRLSLVTQWVFLCGFVGALPLLLVSRRIATRSSRWNLLAEFVLTLIGYAAFHWTTAILLSLKYELSQI